MNVRKSTTWPSALNTSPPSSTHWQWSQPEEKLHLPESVKPPSVCTALPVGAYDELSRVLGVLAPDRLLRLVGEQRDLPRVHADHAGDPAGRAAGAGDVAHRGVEVDRVGLEAVEPLGLQQPEEAGLLELLDRRLGDHAQPLGLVGALAEGGQQVADAVENRLAHGLLLVDVVLSPPSILEHVLVSRPRPRGLPSRHG